MRQQWEWLECNNTRAADELSWCLLTDHLSRGGNVAVVYTEHIDLEHSPQIFFCQIQERLDLRNTGIRYHGIEVAEFLD